MSTNSTIKIERKNGTSTEIYCHWDGYIERVGLYLQLAYNTADKVEELLALGNLSSLGLYVNPKEDSEHDFNNPQPNVCVAYHRDIGEEFEQYSGRQKFNYTFYESYGVWYVDKESWEDSKASEVLDVYPIIHKERLLLDELLESEYIDKPGFWEDDEFAVDGHVKDACINKALEGRHLAEHIDEEGVEEYELV